MVTPDCLNEDLPIFLGVDVEWTRRARCFRECQRRGYNIKFSRRPGCWPMRVNESRRCSESWMHRVDRLQWHPRQSARGRYRLR